MEMPSASFANSKYIKMPNTAIPVLTLKARSLMLSFPLFFNFSGLVHFLFFFCIERTSWVLLHYYNRMLVSCSLSRIGLELGLGQPDLCYASWRLLRVVHLV